jgi:hypothetical protein
VAPLELSDTVVAITGGGGGIGVETAIAFAGAGAHVAIGDLDGDAARRAAALIEPHGHGYSVDVRVRESVERFAEQLTGDLGSPLVWVNGAGIMPLGRFVEEEEEVMRRTIEVNLWGVLHGTQVAARAMTARGQGHIVNVASMMGRMHAAGAATYGASKHAVVGLGGAVGEELAGSGVTLTTVLPSAVRTPLISGLSLGGFPPVVEPYEVAAAVLRSCGHRRPEVTVPRWLGRAPEGERLMPRGLRAQLRAKLGGDAALTGVDTSLRGGYERRIREAELVR